MAVAREGEAGDGLVRGLQGGAQASGQRAFACAVDTLDHDEHAASLTRARRSQEAQESHHPLAGLALEVPALVAVNEALRLHPTTHHGPLRRTTPALGRVAVGGREVDDQRAKIRAA